MKYVFLFLSLLVSIFLSQWMFNHIDAWLGIFFMVAIAVTYGYYLIKFIKQKINQK